jgi:putative MATE family efflux protein
MTKKLTEGTPAKLIITFTIPLLIGNIFQQFYSMADTWIVGRTLGVNSLAAVGCTGSMSFLILGFIIGLTSGLSIVTAQRYGAGDEDGVRRSFVAGIWVSLAVTIILTILAFLFTRQILEVMRTPGEIIDEAYDYIIVILVGIISSTLFNFLSNAIRALGDSKTPLVFLVIASLLNVILDFGFILILHMGVAGAAWATVLSQIISGVLCIIYIMKKFPILHIKKSDLKFNRYEIIKHTKQGVPMGIQMSIIAVGAVILQFVLNGLGAISVAAFTAAQKIDQLAIQPMNSFGMTMATYSAQNYGAGKIKRISQGVLQCSLISVGFSVVMSFVNIMYGYQLSGLFVGKDATQVLDLSQIYLRISASLYFVLALLFVFRFTLQGLGHVVVPTIAGIMELVMRAGAAIILVKSIGFAGAAWAAPLAWIGAAVILIIAYCVDMKRIKKQFGVSS